MAVLKMDHTELTSIAKTYVDASSTIDDTLSKLKSTQTQLASVWEGESFQAFEEQFNALQPKVQQFSTLMVDINKQLNDIATTMADTDSQLNAIITKNTSAF